MAAEDVLTALRSVETVSHGATKPLTSAADQQMGEGSNEEDEGWWETAGNGDWHLAGARGKGRGLIATCVAQRESFKRERRGIEQELGHLTILVGASSNCVDGGQTDHLVKYVARRHGYAHADGGAKGGTAARIVETAAGNTRKADNRVSISNERKGAMRRPSVA